MDLSHSMGNLTIDDPVFDQNSLTCSAEIDGVPTAIVISKYNARLLIIISQFENIGPMLHVKKEQVHSESQQSNNIYSIKPIFGVVSEKAEAAARYLAEQINIEHTLYLFMNLKSYDIETIKACKDIILDVENMCPTNE